MCVCILRLLSVLLPALLAISFRLFLARTRFFLIVLPVLQLSLLILYITHDLTILLTTHPSPCSTIFSQGSLDRTTEKKELRSSHHFILLDVRFCFCHCPTQFLLYIVRNRSECGNARKEGISRKIIESYFSTQTKVPPRYLPPPSIPLSHSTVVYLPLFSSCACYRQKNPIFNKKEKRKVICTPVVDEMQPRKES